LSTVHTFIHGLTAKVKDVHS